jgi:lipid-binding SYLF domain-containing protein
MGGGNFGLQIGAESTDLILVFRTVRSVDAMQSGKVTLGATASVAAGPVGRTASAATDVTLSSEVLSYSRSRGAFAGVALDGAVVTIDVGANRAFYGVDNPLVQQASYEPAAARRFTCTLANYTGGPARACA